ncbi:MAG: hypothetical protein ACK2UG_12955 [Candidatus Promineifilaceae bacterium]
MDEKAKQFLNWLLFAAFCAMATLLLYGAALELPFFFDDFVHYPFVENNNLFRIWLSTNDLAYYRPLNFTIWRITYKLFQGHNPFVDHGINLFLFAVNGFLVGWLASRLWSLRGDRFPVVARNEFDDDVWRIYLSATLFLLFPFSYQAVPWVGSLSHILVTTLILLALLCYVQMRRTRMRLWGMASLFFTFLAPFAHENGVLVMPFVVLVDLTNPGLSHRWRQAARTAVIWTLPLLVYIPIWLSLPRLDNGGLFGSLEGMLQNSAYFLQGATYPFSGIGGWLHYIRGVGDMTAVALLGGLGVSIAVLVQLTHRPNLRSLFPWFWILLASLPAILFLVFDYVINGPRLLMVASVGIAWLWADVILLFSRGGKQGSIERLTRAGIAGLLTLLLLAQNVTFVSRRMTMHQILGQGFEQIISATAAANEAGHEAIVVNFPSWLALKTHTYALGHEGVLFWPDYVSPEILMAVHTGELGDLNFVKVDSIRPDLEKYHYGLTGPAPDWPMLSAVPSQVFKTEYSNETFDAGEGLDLVPVGSLGELRTEDHDILANFESPDRTSRYQLLDARVIPSAGSLRVDTLWQSLGGEADITLFVHLVDAAGNLIGQVDGDPLGGSYPLNQWLENIHGWDSRTISGEEAAGLDIRVGLYDRISGQRLQAVGADGELYPDNFVPLSVDLQSQENPP